MVDGLNLRFEKDVESVLGTSGLTRFDVADSGAKVGQANSSAAFITAAKKAKAAGGGIVDIGVGVFVVEGLPLYDSVIYQGTRAGSALTADGTVLRLPNNPTTDMFTPNPADIQGDLTYAGFKDIHLDGNQLQHVECDFSDSSGLLCTRVSHGMTDGHRIRVINSGVGTAPPTGLAEWTDYFVRDATADAFRVATTLGGSAIAYTDAGTGKHYLIRAQYDLVNFDNFIGEGASRRIEPFTIDDCVINNFRVGYHNRTALSDIRDRAPIFRNCYFRYNGYAIYTNEHPRLTVFNDIRDNGIGMTGGDMYDCFISNQAMNANVHAIKPDLTNGGQLGRSTITGCFFVFNENGIYVNQTSNLISNNQFAAGSVGSLADGGGLNVDDCSYAIFVDSGGADLNITGNSFQEEDGDHEYQNGAVCFNLTAGERRNVQIMGNNVFIRTKFIGFLSNGVLESIGIDSNNIYIAPVDGAHVIDNSINAMRGYTITNNKIFLNGNIGATTDLFDIASSAGRGGVITNNAIWDEAGGTHGFAFNGDFDGCVFSGNWFRGIGVNMTAVGGGIVPNGATIGSSDAGSDGATLKSLNTFIN